MPASYIVGHPPWRLDFRKPAPHEILFEKYQYCLLCGNSTSCWGAGQLADDLDSWSVHGSPTYVFLKFVFQSAGIPLCCCLSLHYLLPLFAPLCSPWCSGRQSRPPTLLRTLRAFRDLKCLNDFHSDTKCFSHSHFLRIAC